eukprot:TRINITY_DN915_c0_g2_i3.p1 TRINITY_DN915_c0_g2~~TRINITY_DN915_c0_g2_i3.p1  ORF type:complete len:393 (+),score=128.53 TRINITY_DN915_c0_g2_i3:25-1203(+)
MEDIVICDNGTGVVKCGFATDTKPRFTFPSVVGRPMIRADEDKLGSDVVLKDVMVGEDAVKYRQHLDINAPLDKGIIRDWDSMRELWTYTFDKLGVLEDCSDKKLVLTEPPLNPLSNRKKMFQVMFEEYGFESAQVHIQAILALYGTHNLSGLVLDSGDGVSHVVGIYDGYLPIGLEQRLNLAGSHITDQLIKLMSLRGYAFNRSSDFQTVDAMKRKLSYVAYDPKMERKLEHETTVLMEKYQLPDGSHISLGRERYMAPEILFDPSLVDVEHGGVANMIFDLIQKAPIDMRTSFYSNIVLSGGTTMLPGFPTRLQKELTNLYETRIRKNRKGGKKCPIRVIDPANREYLVYSGGVQWARLVVDAPDAWISKAEYEEQGIDRMLQLKGFRRT